MNPGFFEQISEIYRQIDATINAGNGNLCKSCYKCCTSIASMGISNLEFDYIRLYLGQNERNIDDVNIFVDYIDKVKNEENKLIYNVCPFYDIINKQCSIYPARTLACRTYGIYMNEKNMDRIPESCYIKKNVIQYNDTSFAEKLPFARRFYELVYKYEIYLKSNT